MFSKKLTVKDFDSQLWTAVVDEAQRQEDHIELIASENYTSPCVMEMQGSLLTNKYAEGYPGKRYYGGCEFVDVVEDLARARAKQLFQAHYANVQPHSGSQANAASYMALIKPGDTILAMDLSNGGHLTHGSPVNFSGQVYHAVHYGVVPETGLIDYEHVLAMAKKHRPKVIVAGFSAYSRIVDWRRFREIADEIGAYLFVDMAHVAGLVAVDLYPSPVNIADVTSSTTHKTLRGPRSGLILAKENADLEKRLNSAIFPGTQGGPLMHVIAAKAIAFKEAMSPEFRTYQMQVLKNAKAMAKVIMARGKKVVSGGTDNHMFLIDLTGTKVTGKDAEHVLGLANITVNKNTVPGEPLSPFITSGVRVGTPAVTTRGFKEPEVERVAHWICDLLEDIQDKARVEKIKKEAVELCANFPVYRE